MSWIIVLLIMSQNDIVVLTMFFLPVLTVLGEIDMLQMSVRSG
jgi:hypothetical protein